MYFVAMIELVFRKNIITGIGGLALVLNQLGEIIYQNKIALLINVLIFMLLLFLNSNRIINSRKNKFSKLLSENLQLVTTVFFVFLLLYFILYISSYSNPDFSFQRIGSEYFAIMISQAYEKAIIFIPASFLVSLIFSIRSSKIINEDILDDNL